MEMSADTNLRKVTTALNGTLEWEANSANCLIVVVHGFRSSPCRMMQMCQSIADANPNADVLVPQLAHSSLKSRIPAWEIALGIAHQIDGYWEKKKYKFIRLVGHSMGAPIARRVAIIAMGEQVARDTEPGRFTAPFEYPLHNQIADDRVKSKTMRNKGSKGKSGQCAWATAIDRLVILAGMNTGWTTDSPLSMVTSVKWSVGSAAAHIWEMVVNRNNKDNGLTIFNIRKGAVFIVQNRMQWMTLRKNGLVKKINVVQLLGNEDDFVSPQQDVDRVVDRAARKFHLIELKETDHENIVTGEGRFGEERLKKIALAVTAEIKVIKEISVDPDNFFDLPPAVAENKITKVVFVIHGIRDRGYWTSRIAAAVKSKAKSMPNKSMVASETSSYGYFAMVPFVLPWVRRQKVEWLMDRYVEQRAKYPNAVFSYVGHSNGTYLLARAILDYPCCTFDNVVFAGSVVRIDYWSQLLENNAKDKVGPIFNYVANADWVVTFFPRGLEWLRRWFDLGGAGYLGLSGGAGKIVNLKLAVGNHSAALKEGHWDDIADFVLNGKSAAIVGEVQKDHLPEDGRFSKAYYWLEGWLGWAAPVVPFCALTLIFGPIIWFFCQAYNGHSIGGAIGLTSLAFLWALLAKFVVTRL